MRIYLKNNGLKDILVLIILLFAIVNKGCSDSKVLDDNTSIKEIKNNNEVTITEIKDPFKEEKYKRFTASYFKDGKIYGNLATIKPEIKGDNSNLPYIIDEYGTFTEDNLSDELFEGYKSKAKLSSNLLVNMYHKGIYEENSQNYDGVNKMSYFIDTEQGRKFPLEKHIEYEKIIKENCDDFYQVYNFKDYYFVSYSNYRFFNYNKDDKSYIDKKDRKNQFLLIDEVNKKEYISEVMEEMPYIFFNKDEKAIMTVNNQGIIYKLIINNEKIEKEEYSKIPLEDLGLNNLSGETYSILYPKDNLLVFWFYGPNNKTVIYDIESKQWNIVAEKETFIEIGVENTDLFITSKKDLNLMDTTVYYLERINKNLEFEVVGKLLDSNELPEEEKGDYLLNNALGDIEGNKVFITISRYKTNEKEHSSYKDVKYFLVDINY